MYRSNKLITVLSIDGGGIRGIIPLMVLEKLYGLIKKDGVDAPFYDLFDVIAGTSTGGMIALGLCSESDDSKPVKDLLSFYEDNSQSVFNTGSSNVIEGLTRLFKSPIDPTNFESILAQYFGDDTLKDLKTDTYISALNIETIGPTTFNALPPNASDNKNYYLKDVARATSSEPALFPPAQISNVSGTEKLCLIDGGIYANNPCLFSYLYAKNLHPNASKYLVVSLGTGDASTGYPCKDVKKWGLLNWVSPAKGIPIINVFNHGQINNATMVTAEQNDIIFYRFQPKIPKSIDSLSNASDENIDALEAFGTKYSKEIESDLKKIATYLTTNYSN